jgi:hypothetical protein
VTGTATLGGTLVALPEPGIYYLGEQFNFIRADGGINGQFAKTDFSAFSPFLQFSLAYGANGTRIDVARGASLASAATTPNQRAVAAAADLLAINQGLPKPLTQLFPQQVGGVLDGLSGELHRPRRSPWWKAAATCAMPRCPAVPVQSRPVPMRATPPVPGCRLWRQQQAGRQQQHRPHRSQQQRPAGRYRPRVLRLAGRRAGRHRPHRRQAAGAVPSRRSTTPTSVPMPATTGAASACVAASPGASTR